MPLGFTKDPCPLSLHEMSTLAQMSPIVCQPYRLVAGTLNLHYMRVKPSVVNLKPTLSLYLHIYIYVCILALTWLMLTGFTSPNYQRCVYIYIYIHTHLCVSIRSMCIFTFLSMCVYVYKQSEREIDRERECTACSLAVIFCSHSWKEPQLVWIDGYILLPIYSSSAGHFKLVRNEGCPILGAPRTTETSGFNMLVQRPDTGGIPRELDCVRSLYA